MLMLAVYMSQYPVRYMTPALLTALVDSLSSLAHSVGFRRFFPAFTLPWAPM
jgi:hypothetical protein